MSTPQRQMVGKFVFAFVLGMVFLVVGFYVGKWGYLARHPASSSSTPIGFPSIADGVAGFVGAAVGFFVGLLSSIFLWGPIRSLMGGAGAVETSLQPIEKNSAGPAPKPAETPPPAALRPSPTDATRDAPELPSSFWYDHGIFSVTAWLAGILLGGRAAYLAWWEASGNFTHAAMHYEPALPFLIGGPFFALWLGSLFSIKKPDEILMWTIVLWLLIGLVAFFHGNPLLFSNCQRVGDTLTFTPNGSYFLIAVFIGAIEWFVWLVTCAIVLIKRAH